jgi:ubiquinone/menaquinone biosynthesis C-methylase UbiE
VKNAGFICADALRLPFREDYFDLVFSRDVFHHVSDKDGMFQEIIRVLKRPVKPTLNLRSIQRHLFCLCSRELNKDRALLRLEL